MATNKYLITITTTHDLSALADLSTRPVPNLCALGRFIDGMAGGTKVSTALDVQVAPVAASGTLTISSGTGVVGGSINGVAVTVTWATSDTASATALVAAINASANPLVAGIVSAASLAGVVTISAVQGGKAGNAVTLAASGTGVTASGARLTGGTGAPGANTISFG